jgi:hypothetical protein
MMYRIPIFSSFVLALALLVQQSVEAAPPTKVTVTAAVPDEAFQGAALPVVISGENFDAGSTVRFLVSGTKDDSQIEIGTVMYNPDGTLTADIQVRDDAQVIEYDIEVRTSSGRRGKGTSLFSVKSGTDSNTGGFGELGNGCVAFDSPATLGTFHEDGGGAYCNGTDGQVSVPRRLRLDTTKFNGNDRKYFLDAEDCEANSTVCKGTVEVEVLQSQLRHRLIDGELVATGEEELDFQGMTIGEIARVSVDLAIGKDTRVLFGNDSGDRMRCPAPSQAAPVWVSCDDDFNNDGFCDLWTVSTENLGGPDALPDEGNAQACLKQSVKRSQVLLDGEITADFTMGVCVLGVSCP